MGKFNAKIVAEFNPPRKWVLGRDLSYTTKDLTVEEIKALKGVGVKVKRETNKTETITVPKGFVTDLASVPRAMWWAIAPFDVARAAIIHDLLYKCIRQYRCGKEGMGTGSNPKDQDSIDRYSYYNETSDPKKKKKKNGRFTHLGRQLIYLVMDLLCLTKTISSVSG